MDQKRHRQLQERVYRNREYPPTPSAKIPTGTPDMLLAPKKKHLTWLLLRMIFCLWPVILTAVYQAALTELELKDMPS